MVPFLSWSRPSPEDQKASINKSSGEFNYDVRYRKATCNSINDCQQDKNLSNDGFIINHSRVLLGSGSEMYDKGKSALQTWNTYSLSMYKQMHYSDGVKIDRHFGLNWTFVDPKTPVQSGVKFCVCVKEFLPWVMMPLQVVYVKESMNPKTATASFGFGSGTLQGHLLAGEERFSIELDEKNKVWYEILSFSKPAHFLAFIGYPYVRLRQQYFARESSKAVLKHLSSSN